MRVALAILLAAASLSAAPKVFVQWTRLHPQGWEPVSDWSKLPKKADPTQEPDRRRSGSPVDDEPGWVAAVKIEGSRTVVVYGCDQYAVKVFPEAAYSFCWVAGRLDVQRVASDDSTWWIPLPSVSDDEIRHGKYVFKSLWWEHLDKLGLPHPGPVVTK